MRISDWSSDVCSSDLGAACRQLCLCCQDSVAGYSPNVFANAERAWDGGNSMIHILGILFSTLGSGVLCAGMAKHQSRLVGRSEEHTSELQSLMRISYAVFCLKKKTQLYQTAIRQ